MLHRIEATFPRRADAVDAIDHLLEAHVPPHRIELVGPSSRTQRILEKNRMVRPALLGAGVGLVASMLLLALGLTQIVPLPVLADVIASAGVGGAALRLAYLGVGTGVVSGALFGLTTWARPESSSTESETQPHRVRVRPVGDAQDVRRVLAASNLTTLRSV